MHDVLFSFYFMTGFFSVRREYTGFYIMSVIFLNNVLSAEALRRTLARLIPVGWSSASVCNSIQMVLYHERSLPVSLDVAFIPNSIYKDTGRNTQCMAIMTTVTHGRNCICSGRYPVP